MSTDLGVSDKELTVSKLIFSHLNKPELTAIELLDSGITDRVFMNADSDGAEKNTAFLTH